MLKELVFELFKTPIYGDACGFNIFNIDTHYFDKKISFPECEDILIMLNEELSKKPRWERINALCKKYDYNAKEYMKHLGESKIECKPHYEFDIENCEFIKKIVIHWHNIDGEMDIKFYPRSRLRRYNIENKTVEIDIDSYMAIEFFDFNFVRYSLYLVYYKYLLEKDNSHMFIRFVNFLGTLHSEIRSIHYMTFDRYINDVDENRDFPIPKKLSEKLFINIYFYVSSYFEKIKKESGLGFGYRF